MCKVQKYFEWSLNGRFYTSLNIEFVWTGTLYFLQFFFLGLCHRKYQRFTEQSHIALKSKNVHNKSKNAKYVYVGSWFLSFAFISITSSNTFCSSFVCLFLCHFETKWLNTFIWMNVALIYLKWKVCVVDASKNTCVKRLNETEWKKCLLNNLISKSVRLLTTHYTFNFVK